MKLLLFLVLIFSSEICKINGAKILGIFHAPAPSHYILASSLMKGLVDAGHNVTFVTCTPEQNPLKGVNFKLIELKGFFEDIKEFLKDQNLFELKENGVFNEALFTTMVGLHFTQKTLEDSNLQNLLKSNEKFDVVIIEQFENDALKMIAHHYKAPLILFSSSGSNVWVNNWVANPAPQSYVTALFAKFSDKMNFWERFENTMISLWLTLWWNFYTLPRNRALAKKHFPNSPPLDEILYNSTSLIFLNSHPSMNQPVPLVPNMVEIGGFHLRPPGKLAKDLQNFLDNATEGVIYFSMGSNLKSAELPPEKRDAFLNSFGKLKEKVIWKWEDDSFPNLPPNLKLLKWAPQQEILAHPNVKLFITHGGLLSTIETVCYGVPILAIPVFGDQVMNAINSQNNGYGISLPFKEVTERTLWEKLEELLNNPKYSENAKRRSRIYNNREMKPMERAVFWVEYVIRHKGAAHLMVEGVHLPWYKYLLLDVIAFIVVSGLILLIVFWVFLRTFCCKRNRRSNKLKKNN